MSEARTVVERRRSDVQKIAAALFKNEFMTGDEIAALLSTVQPKLRLIAPTARQDDEVSEDFYECH